MNILEKLQHKDYRTIRAGLNQDLQRIKDELFICTIWKYCEDVENFHLAYPQIEEVVLGFALFQDDYDLTVKSLHIKKQWNKKVTFLDLEDSNRIKQHTGIDNFTISLNPYDKKALLSKLIGPALSQSLFMEALDNSLPHKGKSKKIKL